MRLPRSLAAAVPCSLAAIVVWCAAPATAHVSPAGCTSTSPNVQFGSSDPDANLGIIHRNGDVVEVLPRVGNSNGANPCDMTDVTLSIEFPDPDGTASGQKTTIATGVDLPSGTPLTDFQALQHTLAFDDGVFRGLVTIAYGGVHHNFEGHSETPAGIGSSGRFAVISRPHATVTVTPTPASGDAPLGVTYTYTVHNDSPLNPMDIPVDLSAPVVADDLCSPLSAPTGDTDMDTLLDRGETWTYTCSRTLPGGAFTNTATLTGTSGRDGRPWPVATAQSTVTVNGADMTVTKSHTDAFTQGDDGRKYTIVARNSGNREATGAVTVSDTLPAGLTAAAIGGTGWTCDVGTVSCARSDALPAGGEYPPITVTVDVADDAPSSVMNTANISRTGDNAANNQATDTTTIAARATPGGGGGDGGGNAGPQDAPGGPGGGSGGGATSFVPDSLAPSLASARVTNQTFTVDAAGPAEPVVRARARKGTSFVYRLSEPARVLFTIERREKGRRVGRNCKKPSRSNRRRKPCVRFVKVGTFAQDGAAGSNTRKWSGKIRTRALKPGAYRASVGATDAAGNASALKRLSFKVVRR
jgi:uncharacterized repeat protein (TIGR01451 family)